MDVAEVNLRLERKVQQLQALIDFGRALAGVADPEDVLRRLALTLAGQWALRRWCLVAVREGREPLVRQRGMDHLAARAAELASRRALAALSAPVRLRDAPGGHAGDDPLLEGLAELGAEAVIPFVSGETVLGFAALGERPGRAPFTDDDLEHAFGLAAQAVVALEGTWQSQEASHWRRLSHARDEWQRLDPLARLTFLAVARLGGRPPAPGEEPDTALQRLLADAGAGATPTSLLASVDRLVGSGAVSRGEDGALRIERDAWLLLPEARLPLAEVARATRLRVGAYELFERIGSGGMGDVYRAENVHDRTPAAVKLLADRVGEDQDLRQRFEREGSIVAQLAHPSIVRLYERGEHEGRLYLAMELLDGEPLSTSLRRGPLPLAEVLAGARDMASALHALHGKGVVHRDVKTPNVMRTATGKWVLLDFGIARSLDEATRTREGMLVGTLPYMSPERVMGKAGGKSADVWALGIVLFELLTGRRPWEAESSASLAVEILQKRPDVAGLVTPAAGSELAALLGEMLDPDPRTRIQDGAALMRALLDVDVADGAELVWSRPPTDGPQLFDEFDSRADTA